jgi:hypothetical protein
MRLAIHRMAAVAHRAYVVDVIPCRTRCGIASRDDLRFSSHALGTPSTGAGTIVRER